MTDLSSPRLLEVGTTLSSGVDDDAVSWVVLAVGAVNRRSSVAVKGV
jgi:hypothetical protein